MERIETTKDGILIESAYFDAEATLFSGQCFRAEKTQSGLTVISGGKKCTLCERTDKADKAEKSDKADKAEKSDKAEKAENNNETFLAKEPFKTKQTLLITDSPEYFFNYFDLGTDYGEIVGSLSRFPELAADIRTGRGIHILRQPLFETIISFIISANNNIPRISGIIRRLCEKYGEKNDGFYAFPTPLALRDAKAADYAALGAGYRAEYLESTLKTILSGDILEKLPQTDYENALKTLLGLKGVGRKVADCICLFALYHTDCYPVDTWIQKRDGLCPDRARRAAQERYGSLAGYAQQYKFYSAVKNKGQQ